MRFIRTELYGAEVVESPVEKSILTKHGKKRARRRVGTRRGRSQQLADEAWDLGLHHRQAKGSLRRYLDKILKRGKSADRIVVYKDRVFLFFGHVFLTVWALPHNLRTKPAPNRKTACKSGWRQVDKKPREELEEATSALEGVSYEEQGPLTFKFPSLDTLFEGE